jgi:hypothetical protein
MTETANAAASQGVAGRPADRLLRVAIVALLLLGLGIRLLTALSPLRHHYGLERNVVFGVQSILAGLPLYGDPESEPFAVIQYGPFFYHLTALLCRATGSTDGLSILYCGRMISLCAGVAVAAGVAWQVRRFAATHGSPWWTETTALLSAAAAFFSLLPEQSACRPDALKTLLLMASLGAAMNGTTRRHGVVAAVLAVLGAITKQDCAWALAAVVGVFWYRGERGAARAAALTAAALAALVATALFIVPMLSKNVIRGVKNPLYPAWAWENVIKRGVLESTLAGPAIAACLLGLRSARRELRLVAALSLAAGVISLVTGLKWGSGAHYLVDFYILSIVTGAALVHASNDIGGRALRRAWSTLMAAVVFMLFVNNAALFRGLLKYARDVSRLRVEWAQATQVKAMLEPALEDGAWLLTDDDGLSMQLPRRVLFPQPDIVYEWDALRITNTHGAYTRGGYSYRRFQEMADVERQELWVLLRDNHPDHLDGQRYASVVFSGCERRQVEGYSAWRCRKP